MKRLALIIAAALAGIVLAVALAGSGSAQQPGEQSIKLVERPSSDHFVDNPPKGTRRNRRISAGDFALQRHRSLTSRTRRGSERCTRCASRHAAEGSPA